MTPGQLGRTGDRKQVCNIPVNAELDCWIQSLQCYPGPAAWCSLPRRICSKSRLKITSLEGGWVALVSHDSNGSFGGWVDGRWRHGLWCFLKSCDVFEKTCPPDLFCFWWHFKNPWCSVSSVTWCSPQWVPPVMNTTLHQLGWWNEGAYRLCQVDKQIGSSTDIYIMSRGNVLSRTVTALRN